MVIGCNIKFLKKFNIENASFIRNQIAGWVGELGWGGGYTGHCLPGEFVSHCTPIILSLCKVSANNSLAVFFGGLSNILPSLCCAQSFHWDTCHFL